MSSELPPATFAGGFSIGTDAPLRSDSFGSVRRCEAISHDNEVRLYAAIFVRDGEICELAFPARSIGDAKIFCIERGFGLKGLVGEAATTDDTSATLTIEEVMCALQLSRSSILRLLAKGSLRRVPRIRAVRITRRSLDEYLAS